MIYFDIFLNCFPLENTFNAVDNYKATTTLTTVLFGYGSEPVNSHIMEYL